MKSINRADDAAKAAILTSDEDNMDPSILPHGKSETPLQIQPVLIATVSGNLNSLLHTWYSASLYCLEVAKYTRNSDFMHVQAIGILQMCCNAVGDIVFRNRLMAIGIQIANDLELPFKAGTEHSLIDSEVSKRLWWVFVIGEWSASNTSFLSVLLTLTQTQVESRNTSTKYFRR